MNERIRELALEAGIASRKYSFGQYWEGNLTEEQIRFAELIVRECIEVAGKDWHTPDGWGYESGQRKAIEFIKEHFGVK